MTFGVKAVQISGARGHFGAGRQLTCHTQAFSKSIEFQGLEQGSEAFRVIPLHATFTTEPNLPNVSATAESREHSESPGGRSAGLARQGRAAGCLRHIGAGD